MILNALGDTPPTRHFPNITPSYSSPTVLILHRTINRTIRKEEGDNKKCGKTINFIHKEGSEKYIIQPNPL